MTEATLKDKIFELDGLVTRIEGAASALAGLNCQEVPHQVGAGRAWLAGEINGLVHELRELTNSIFEASRDSKPPLKSVGDGGPRP